MDSLPDLGIAGVAGISDHLKAISTNLKQGNPPKLAGSITVEEPLEVQTLDECLVIIPRMIFNELKFDSEVCDDWHLYAVDYSLSVRKAGYRAFVLPLETYHRSSGFSMSARYYATLKKVLKKHRGHFPVIYTTMGYWNPSQSVYVNRFNHMVWRATQVWIRIKRLVRARAMSLWTRGRA